MFSPPLSGHRSQLRDVIPHIKGSVRAQQRVGNMCDSREPGCSLAGFFLWCHYLRLASMSSTLWQAETHTHTHIHSSCLPWCQQIYDCISPLRKNLIRAADTLMPPVTDLLLSGSAVKAIFALDNSVGRCIILQAKCSFLFPDNFQCFLFILVWEFASCSRHQDQVSGRKKKKEKKRRQGSTGTYTLHWQQGHVFTLWWMWVTNYAGLCSLTRLLLKPCVEVGYIHFH